jgi:hypothetical protein
MRVRIVMRRTINEPIPDFSADMPEAKESRTSQVCLASSFPVLFGKSAETQSSE